MKNKKLFRNKKEGMLGGVCAGLGDYFEIDHSIIRIIFIIAMILGGGGLIAYLIFWLIIPEKQDENTVFFEEADFSEKKPEKQSGNTNFILGVILIFIGLFFILERFFRSLNLSRYWPVILIVVGIIIIYFSINKKNHYE